jgi:hypothetical protein
LVVPCAPLIGMLAGAPRLPMASRPALSRLGLSTAHLANQTFERKPPSGGSAQLAIHAADFANAAIRHLILH